VRHRHPHEVYMSMVRCDSVNTPHDLKQVRVAKLDVQQKMNGPAKTASSVADNVLDVLGMLQRHPFVRKAILSIQELLANCSALH